MTLGNSMQSPLDSETTLTNTIFNDTTSLVMGRQATEEETADFVRGQKETEEDQNDAVNDYLAQKRLDQQQQSQMESDSENLLHLSKQEGFGINNLIDDGSGMSRDYAYRQAKKAMHDYAKMSSAEQSVIDKVNRERAIDLDPELITPQEARSLGEKYGVELKYNKNVARGEVMFSIGQNLYKKELERSLAEFTADQDFSAMQHIGMMGSAISGGIGFYETALTVGLGFLVPQTTVLAAAKIGRLGALGMDIAKGTQLAYKTQRAAQMATRSANTLKTMQSLRSSEEAVQAMKTLNIFAKTGKRLNSQVAKALEDASETTKLAYNLSSLALNNAGAAEAFTLGERAALYATDAVVSSILPMWMSGRSSKIQQTDTYTAKDCAIDSLFAAAIGGVIPVGGVAFKALGKYGGKAFDNFKNHVTKTIDNYHYKKSLEGTTDEAIPATGEKALHEFSEAEKSFKQPDNDYVDLLASYKNFAGTEEEFMENFRYVAQKLCNGEVPNLTALPHKSLVMTHIASDIVDNIKRNINDLSPESASAIRTQKIGHLYHATIKGETGMLGRKTISCYSEAKARELLSDVYKAVLDNDMDAYIRVASFAEQQRALVDTILSLEIRAEDLRIHNEKYRGTKQAIKFKDQEKFIETLKDDLGRFKYGQEYDRIKADKEAWDVKVDREGHTAETAEPPQEFAILDEMDKAVEEFFSPSTLDDGTVAYNTKIQELFDFAAELDTSSRDLADLLNSDDILLNKYKSADDLVEAINEGTVYKDTDLTQLFGMPRTTTDDLKVRLQDLENQQELASLEKQKWEASQAEPDFEEVNDLFSRVDEDSIDASKDPTKLSFYSSNKVAVERIETFLATGLSEMKANLQNLFTTAEFQKFIDVALKKGAEPTRKAILKGNTSLIRSLIDTHVGKPLEQLGVRLSETDIVALADRFVETIETGKAVSLKVDTEAKVIDKALPEEEMLKKAQEGMQKPTVMDDLIDPLLVEVQKLALNKQFQHLHSLNIVTKHAQEIMKNPYIPGEVIVKIFTFSPYNLDGSNVNIENIVRNSQAYVRDIEAELRRKSPGTTATDKLLTGGVDLVEYMRNPANRKGIMTAWAYMDWYGSADAAKKAGVPFNSDDAVVAQVIRDRYATVLNNLANVGSLKQKIGNRHNLTKMRQSDRFIPDAEIADVQKCFDNILELSAEKGSGLEKDLKALGGYYKRLQGSDRNRLKLTMFALKHFDLDKMFNARGTSSLNLNDVRDALFTGEFIHLAKENPDQFRKMVNAMGRITEAFTGKPYKLVNGKSEFKKGWLNSYIYKLDSFTDIKNNLSNRYVDNFHDMIIFKDVESELKAMDFLGYDSIVDQLNHDFETGQRAYAVLKMAGSEPIRLAEDLINFAEKHRDVHQHDLFLRGSRKEEDAALSETARHSIMQNAAMAAGVDYVASRTITRIAKAVSDLFSAPLLVNAGFRSTSDYVYQQEWMILNGLIESKDLTGWTRGIDSAKELFQDPELRRIVGYNQFMTQDFLLRLRTNVDTDSLGSGTQRFDSLKEMWAALTDGKGTKTDRLERYAKAYSTLMINDIGCVDKFTNLHRSSAALTLMKAISSQADTSFDSMVKNKPGLANLLKRHGIEGADWDFLRQHCNIEFSDYIKQNGAPNSNLDRDFKLFIPDNLLNISDDVFKKEMQARGFDPNSKIAFDNFRNDMYEKASILINSSADEMTTLPTYRTANAMSFGANPASGLGQGFKILTKFQSFGMACTQIHFGRRVAQYCDTTDTANVQTIWNMLLGRAGNPAGTGKAWASIAHLMITTSMAQLMIDEAMDYAKGQHQPFLDKDGKLNKGKIVDPIIASTGIFSPILDGSVGKLAQGNRTTSGIQIQAAPAVQEFYRDVTRVAKPLFEEDLDTEERLSRFTAASTAVFAKKAAVSNYALTSLVWRHAVGGWLEEQERGAKNYRRYIKGKRREGHAIDRWYSRFQTNPEPVFGLFN